METPDSLLVKAAFASHLGGTADAFDESQHLFDDLELEPLDLVLISMQLERAIGVEFPVACLEDVQTVGDVSAVVRRWLGVVPVLRRAAARQRSGERMRSRARARSRGHLVSPNRRRAL